MTANKSTYSPILFCLASLFTLSQSDGAIKVFSASDFPSAWTTVDPTNGTTADPDSGGGGSFEVNAVASGGNPGSYLSILLDIGSGNRFVETFSYLPTFTHNPSTQGEITSIDYSFDTQRGASSAAGNAQAYGIALEQDGIHYLVYHADSVTSWQTVSANGIGAGDFGAFSGNTDEALINNATTPDFSSSGSEITFGYYRGNSTVAVSAFVAGHLDNYSLTLDFNPTAVPEPALASTLLGIAIVIGLIARKQLRNRENKA